MGEEGRTGRAAGQGVLMGVGGNHPAREGARSSSLGVEAAAAGRSLRRGLGDPNPAGHGLGGDGVVAGLELGGGG